MFSHPLSLHFFSLFFFFYKRRTRRLLQLHVPQTVILTSFGALEPKSVSDGWMDSNTPAISPVVSSYFATLKTALPFNAATFLLFSFCKSSASDLAATRRYRNQWSHLYPSGQGRTNLCTKRQRSHRRIGRCYPSLATPSR